HHEESDVNVRALLWFLAIFVILSVITHFALHLYYKGLSRLEKAKAPAPLTQMQRAPDADVPQGQPLLQPFPRETGEGVVIEPYRNTPVTDLHDMREAEKKGLENYGWIDQEKGIVRIPIDEAKRLVVERGLPLQGGAPAPSPANRTTTPSGAPAPSPADRGTNTTTRGPR
ncbi:MAG TPA: hypothetical protein VF057_07970, partial [Thermoanaerobaculia bacterium]